MSTLNAIQIQSLVRNMDESLRKYKKLKQTNNALWLKKLEEENKYLKSLLDKFVK